MRRSAFILLTVAVSGLLLWGDAGAGIAIVVNKSNPVTELTLQQLRQIYLGEVTRFPNGQAVFLVEYGPVSDSFYEAVLGKSSEKMKKHWISMVFSGKSAIPPKEFKDIDDLLKFISKNPNAIAFVDSSQLIDSVKVVAIEGKTPRDKDYLLK